MEAPTFTRARQELYGLLSRYTFGRVVRCTVPADGKQYVGDKLSITYFHGLATKMEYKQLPVGSRPVKLWFKKAPADAQKQTLHVGPLSLDAADEEYVPRPGDVIVGNVVPSDRRRQPSESRDFESGGGGAGQGAPESNDRFTYWHPHAASLECLLNFLYNGTAIPEAQLAHELRSRKKGGEDDVWAVARLILFGNVAAFAAQHVGALSGVKPMRLSMPPLDFVWNCATKLDDETIWQKFVELVPDAQPPRPPSPPEPLGGALKSSGRIIPPLFGPGSEPPPSPPAPFSSQPAFVGRARRSQPAALPTPPPPPPPVYSSASYTHADAYSPHSPSYYPPAQSPQHVPYSPHHSPAHPAYGDYSPQSPQHSPYPTYASPAHPSTASFFNTDNSYTPRSPLYSPSNSPPYCPTTPPGEFHDDSDGLGAAPLAHGAAPLAPPTPTVNADSVLRLLQRVSSIQNHQYHQHTPPQPRSFSPPHG